MEFTTLLKDLGQAVNIPELAPDENGLCTLSLDDIIVDIKAEASGKHILLFSEIAPLPIEHANELITEILAANNLFNGTNSATLALNSQTKTVTLQQQEALALLDVEAFSELLNNFVNTIENWKSIINDFQQKESFSQDYSPDEFMNNSEIIRG